MNSLTLQLFDSQNTIRLEGITSFVGQDATGSFGIQPGHARFITVLVPGLARFRSANTPWQYVALPGAVLYLAGNILNLACRHFLIAEDYDQITTQLTEELLVEEEQLVEVRQSLKTMEEQLLKQMWEMRRQGLTVL